MNNRFLFALVSALCAGTINLRAQAPAAPAAADPGVSITATGAVVSDYMFRGQRLGGFSFQPSLEFDSGNTALGVWINKPIADKVPFTSDPEFDFYGTYDYKIQEGLSITPGFTYYVYPSAPNYNFKSTFEPNIAVNYTFSGLKVTPKVYYDMVLKGATYEVTGAYAVPLKDMGTELDFTAVYGTYRITDSSKDAYPMVKNWGSYAVVGVSLPFQIDKDSKVTAGWNYSAGWKNEFKSGSDHQMSNPLVSRKGVVSLSYSRTF